MPGIADLMDAITGGAHTSGNPISESSSGNSQSTTVPDIDMSNSNNGPSGENAGSFADDVMADIAAAMPWLSPA